MVNSPGGYKHSRACLVFDTRCDVGYEGRGNSTPAAGDRMIVHTPDGSPRAYTDMGREPWNREPPGTTV
jgi:RecB family endonuclease NucS